MTSFPRTPYKGLAAVPPARSLTFARANGSKRSEAVTERRFWSFGAERIHDDPRDYESHLRAIFLRSVKDRLRSTRPVWSQLSGGYDSSAVVCAADMLLKTGAASVPDFRTLSFVSNNSADSDESRFMATVEQQCGRVAHRLIQDDKPGRTHPAGHWLSPTQPSYGALESYQLVRDHGARVLFTGEFGDSVMANFTAYHHDVAHLIRSGHPIQGVAMARRRALAEKLRIWELLFAAGMELLPPRVLLDYTMARDLRELGDAESRATANDRDIADTFLIKPEFAHWWREDAATRYRRSLTFEDMSHRRLIREVMSASESRLPQSPSEVPLIRVTHPYVDRRLVELMAAIPIDIAAPPGRPRHLMRQAFAPFMPARVANRFSKGMPAGFWIRNTRDIVSRWVNSPGDVLSLRLPFVDRERVLTYLRRLQVNEVRPRCFILLMRIEQWLQAREQRDRSTLERHSPLSVA
jgi:asparagine synthase (glutamine-hydrolysing)